MDTPMAAQFADMAVALMAEPTMEDTVDRVAEFARDVLECDHAGVLLVHSGQQIETAAATDPVVEKADQLQMALGEGPCIDGMWSSPHLVVVDAATDARWGEWAPRVAALGIRSILLVRSFTPRRTLGALSVYSGASREFDEDDIAVADIFARHASVAVRAAKEEADLWRAIDARHLIGQAQGVLMERYDLSPNQAFGILRSYSQNNNLKLRVVAQQVVSTRSLPATD